METRRWTNPTLPQTLQIAVLFFYIDAAFSVLFGSAFTLLGFLLAAGGVVAGLGIANEQKRGYQLGLALSVVGLIAALIAVLGSDIGLIELALFLLFPVARLALLVHPQSRDYQRIWFR